MRVGVSLRGSQPDAYKGFSEANGAGDAIEHRRADRSLELAHEIRHAGAAEHDRLHAVFSERPLDFGFDHAARV